ncbi:MAG: DegT/DnrJ/EryC1/StrS family aminotransferase [Proteobacteria bacterium]|nr:DegT/DnrJ/EryC1/StrS family aminotransferase [Pseudomonadota bacterium]
MQWKYTLSEPVLGAQELQAVTDCINSGWLSMGPRTKLFEERFAGKLGTGHAIAVSSGTAALHLALAVLGVGTGPDDEVVQPSINFVAGANMTKALGAKPVFADIVSTLEPTISPADIESKLNERTKAVMVMHFGGYCARMPEIMEICQARGIPVIEDACHAPMQDGEHSGRRLGTIGSIGCFSFFSNKNMTTAEGGMVVTDDDDLATRIRNIRSHGMTTSSWEKHHRLPGTYDVMVHGFNYRIDDLRSSLGLAQLDRLPESNQKRRALAACYGREIDRQLGNRALYIFGDRPMAGTAHLAGIVVDADIRDKIRKQLANQGVQSSLHYPPVHLFSAFDGSCPNGLPVSEEFSRGMITLPMHAGLGEVAVQDIVRVLVEAFDRHA